MDDNVKLLKFKNAAVFITNEYGDVKVIGLPAINIVMSPNEAEMMASALQFHAQVAVNQKVYAIEDIERYMGFLGSFIDEVLFGDFGHRIDFALLCFDKSLPDSATFVGNGEKADTIKSIKKLLESIDDEDSKTIYKKHTL